MELVINNTDNVCTVPSVQTGIPTIPWKPPVKTSKFFKIFRTSDTHTLMWKATFGMEKQVQMKISWICVRPSHALWRAGWYEYDWRPCLGLDGAIRYRKTQQKTSLVISGQESGMFDAICTLREEHE